ncbi:hypothetical protein BK126_11065 [Paenibacillus sp. FSL H7-0326]|uniref:hypothetical protein n=1 Tax=Paenibacillus sp. FSL H7-0326 TaxID=1921144 RepID=UPI00096E2068|nr:hypothetical protein [Paenibacillus sp. FSL H7-0326]OMC68374.1 hypothetical protein BK126_11065 [Paenibacillus sp. FSL H7-0326]
MQLFKRFSFWLPLLSVLVCIFNAMGIDDYNILLVLTSPHLALLENIPSIGRHLNGMTIIYFINVFGWLVIGLIIDLIINQFKPA